MRFPRFSWLVFEDQRVTDGKLSFRMRIRRWHPGFWWFIARIVWREWRDREAA